MPKISPMFRPLLFASLAVLTASAQTPRAPSQDPFPGVAPVPMGTTPLAAPPTVIALDHLDPAQMSAADYEVVSNLRAELSKQAALANFDISKPEWHYQQIMCPAFPDYVFLSFTHGPDESGSSRFGAMLSRNSAEVRIVSTYAHGLLPFEASWNRPGTFEDLQRHVAPGAWRDSGQLRPELAAHRGLLCGTERIFKFKCSTPFRVRT